MSRPRPLQILASLSLLLMVQGSMEIHAIEKSSRESRKALAIAQRYYQAGKLDEAITRLEAFLEAHPDDPLAAPARKLLREAGKGEKVRVILLDRKAFHKSFKLPESRVLELAEKALEELEAQFKGIPPVYDEPELTIYFYDSAARYKKATGQITASGSYHPGKKDLRSGTLEGAIHWYIPRQGSRKDREVQARSVILHEGAHHLNSVYFGGLLPSLFEEGVATFLESRLNTDFYVTRRETVRQRYEGEARNGLGRISKLDGFREFLKSTRGFGKGDRMISRWYGYCYSVIDCLAEGKEWDTPSSIGEVFHEISKIAQARKKEALEKRSSSSRSPDATGLLEQLIRKVHDTDLETFHRHLTHHIQKNYKQR